MNASDIMTSPVISVGPETPVHEIATLLLEHRISGVPVVEHGRLIGFVSEGDLLHRQEIGTERKAAGSWWLRLFGVEGPAADYVKSHASRARDIMTREVVSVAPDTGLAEIATLLEKRRIKRVPVLSEGNLVGIVSRANLVRAIATARPTSSRVTPPVDSAIRGRLLAELGHQSWWAGPNSQVIVMDGVVHYWGVARSDIEREAARVAAENVPGVRGVEDHRLVYREFPGAW
jgi:CBS domain-containing protein